MNPVMYLIMNPALAMSTGKGRAQAAHAAVEAYDASLSDMIDAWRNGGHYAKVVLATDDLLVADRYIRDRGFNPQLIIDEGRTEFGADLTPTAIGVPIVDKDDPHVSETFGTFRLYKDKPKEGVKLNYNTHRSFLHGITARLRRGTARRS